MSVLVRDGLKYEIAGWQLITFAPHFVLAQQVFSEITSSYAIVDHDMAYPNLYMVPLARLPLQSGACRELAISFIDSTTDSCFCWLERTVPSFDASG